VLDHSVDVDIRKLRISNAVTSVGIAPLLLAKITAAESTAYATRHFLCKHEALENVYKIWA